MLGAEGDRARISDTLEARCVEDGGCSPPDAIRGSGETQGGTQRKEKGKGSGRSLGKIGGVDFVS